MAVKNTNLHSAKNVKNDEFYTLIEDISKEIIYYQSELEGKTVYCNCDDPLDSAFTKYFILRFKDLKLKKLICTFYDVTNTKNAFAFEYEGQDVNGDGVVTMDDIDIIKATKAFHRPLVDDDGFDYDNKNECWKNGIYGKGDFRSRNCIEYLNEADVVVTNPPFSLFREYFSQLMKYEKKFIIIGNKSALTYKEIFPHIQNNKVWLGITYPNKYRLPNGDITNKVNGLCRWFTNIEHSRRAEELMLYKEYSPEKYPKYEDYEAIEVKDVKNIPCDYYGVIGVPVTYLDKYCPSQFDIVGMAEDNGRGYSFGANWNGKNPHCVINGKNMFKRIFIKRKQK